MSDTLLGVFVLIVFLAFVLAAGFGLYQFKNRRFVKAWEPLQGRFEQPAIRGDGGGGATSWISGRIRGRTVHASMSPDLNRSMDGGAKYNNFSVIVPEVPGAAGWQIVEDFGAMGMGAAGFRIVTEDAGVAAALREAGVLDWLPRTGPRLVHYSAGRSGTLTYSVDVRPHWTPSPEGFDAIVDTALRLVELNGRINARHAG